MKILVGWKAHCFSLQPSVQNFAVVAAVHVLKACHMRFNRNYMIIFRLAGDHKTTPRFDQVQTCHVRFIKDTETTYKIWINIRCSIAMREFENKNRKIGTVYL